MPIIYHDNTHSYRLINAPDTPLTSVSKVIELYHEKFDTEEVSRKTAAKRKVDQEQLKQEWKEANEKAIERGKKLHTLKENELNKKKGAFASMIDGDYKTAYDLTELKPGIYTELIVYSPEFRIVGTADYVEIFKDDSFIIRDYKTNKELKFSSPLIWNPKLGEKKPKRMFAPLNHIDDCNGMHYTIQLSCYAYLLELAGYKCKGLELLYVSFDEDDDPTNITPYPLNYIKNDIKSLFQHFKSSTHYNKV